MSGNTGRIQLVVPMAGLGSRFATAGYSQVKPLLPIHGQEMYKVVLANLMSPDVGRIVLVAPTTFELSKRESDMEAALRVPVTIVEIDYLTDGPASTVELSRPHLDPDLPVVTANSDQYVDADLSDFYRKVGSGTCSGVILTMGDDSPKWSYVRTNEAGQVTLIREKEVISNEATVGIYGFASARSLFSSITSMKSGGNKVNGEYYVAPAYDFLLGEPGGVLTSYLGHVGTVMHGLGVPEDYERFLNNGTSIKAASTAETLFKV